jgi:arylsulfatase A-like enzyme
MKRLRRAVALLLGLLALAVAFYAVIVNPSHWRVRNADLTTLTPFKERYRRLGTLLTSQSPHDVNVDPARFEAAREAFAAAFEGSPLLTSSRRFTSRFQVFFSAGLYPFRLEALDALFVPDGATLSFDVPFPETTQLRLSALSPGAEGQLDVVADGAPLSSIAVADVTARGGTPETLLDRKAAGVFSVDKAAALTQWTAVRFAARRRVEITCRGAPRGCLVGDPGFYAPTPEPPRNVVVILVDTMRWDALRDGNAPNLEALAANATRFSNALAPGNMTAPSTNALLACQKASAIGGVAFAYAVDATSREAHYAHRRPSFPQIFTEAGYDSAMIGNVSVISEVFGIGVSHGFQRQISVELDPFDTPLIAREAVHWLARNGDSPFLLYLHFNGPHAPYRAPWSDLARVSRGIFHDMRSYAALLSWLYRGEISYTDAYVGQVLEALRRLGLDEQTTVVVTADHGDQHAVRRFSGNHAAEDFTGSYFDHGATLYNDEIRVPLLVRAAGQKYERTRDDYVSTLDVGPTLLKWSRLQVPSYCDGVPLDVKPKRRVLGSEGFRARSILFDGRWKYVRTYEANDKVVYAPDGWSGKKRLFMVPEELFDLADDPEEGRNLLASEPELTKVARSFYREHYAIKDAFELVIDDPKGLGFTARFAAGSKVEASRSSVALRDEEGVLVATGGEPGRTLLTVRGTLAELPVVEVGGARTTLTMTAQRLPLQLAPSALPVETGGLQTLLPLADKGGALLRRIEDDGQGSRRIMTGNPRFEAVLREWGYLNDQ